MEQLNHPLRDFNPDIDSMDIRWIDSWKVDGHQLRSFRITTSVIDDEPVRTYGIIGFPKKKGVLPAILHIHGGGQTASQENVLYHVRRGYITMTFDWTGLREGREPEKVTSYPSSFDINPGSYLFQLERDGLEKTYVFVAAKAARSCLALLASFDEVDSDRIGIYGISWGGYLTWLVNGTDSLPKCAIPVYGTGGLNWPGHSWNHDWAKANNNTRSLWMKYLEPASYISNQNSPVLHINGTNDFFGGIDVASYMLPMISQKQACDYTPNSNHHFDLGSTRTMEKWFDCYLKNETDVDLTPPQITAKVLDEKIQIGSNGDPEKLTLWYSVGNAVHSSRCWKSANQWQRDENGSLSQNLPIIGNTWLFIRKYCPDSGMAMCSLPLMLHLPETEGIKYSNDLIIQNSFDGIGINTGTDFGAASQINRIVLLNEDKGLTLFPKDDGFVQSLTFFTPSDPKTTCRDDNASLELEIYGAKKINISCDSHEIEMGNTIYSCEINEPVNGINRISPHQLCNADKQALTSFKTVKFITIGCETDPGQNVVLTRMNWG